MYLFLWVNYLQILVNYEQKFKKFNSFFTDLNYITSFFT